MTDQKKSIWFAEGRYDPLDVETLGSVRARIAELEKRAQDAEGLLAHANALVFPGTLDTGEALVKRFKDLEKERNELSGINSRTWYEMKAQLAQSQADCESLKERLAKYE